MGLTYGLIALAAVLGAFTIALFSRARSLATNNDRLRKDYDDAREQIRILAEKERKASGKLDERTQEVQQLKKDLGAQKKKAFENSEKIKGLESELKSAREAAVRATSQRPAFADTPKKEPTAKAEPRPETPDLRGELRALEERLTILESEKTALTEKMAASEGELKKARAELRRSKRRVDEYRRADQVGRSRSELADEKVRYLSRQYYEVVSELAALKGEVAPPPPRELDELRREAAQVERAKVRASAAEDAGQSDSEQTDGDEANRQPAEEATSA